MLPRRALLRAACGHCLAGAGLFSALSAQAQAQPPAQGEALPGRLGRPSLETDEGGLWAMMDREETRLRRSPFVIKEAGLQTYLRDLVCRLGGEHCADVRVHIVRTPQFNASMAPNGMMQVWSGLLLRVDNEAQLAAVLGHEIGHYLERHSLQQLRDVKSRTAFAQFLGMFGLAGALVQVGVLASMFAFSRDQERRADQLGMRLMKQAGYDGRQAATVWDNLLGELKVRGGEDVGKRSPMMATHPPVEDRRDTLLALAGEGGGHLGEAELKAVVAPHRMEWIHEEIRRGQHEESLALFDRMLRREPGDAQALFGRGEVHRLRNADGDLDAAVRDLTDASVRNGAPAEAFRGLGLAYRKRAQGEAAAAAFDRYLTLAPQAADARLIKTYLTELRP